jgi:predicted RNA-binding Zn-ribbon protein involved in translation (DUF1610 family)
MVSFIPLQHSPHRSLSLEENGYILISSFISDHGVIGYELICKNIHCYQRREANMAQLEKLHCRGCGAVLPVRAKAGRIKCEYCGTVHLVDAEQKMVSGDLACPNCGFNNPPESQFCGDCGKALFHICPRCGTQNRVESVFCIKCGADIEKTIREEGPGKNINVDALYTDYLLQGKKTLGEYTSSTMEPAALCGLLIGAGSLIWVFKELDVLGSVAFYVPQISALCFILAIIMIVIIIISGGKIKARVAKITKDKPGFDQFYRSLRQQGGVFNWPDSLPDENKRKEFLFLIGHK